MTEAELAFAFAEQAVKEATELETPDLVLSSAKYAALECFPQAISEHKLLYRLYADRTQVTDLTPIASLTQLKELWLQRTPIHDLSPLTGLLDLEELQLSETNVVDLSPLRSLNSLERLTVNNTHVSSVAVLSELQSLEELEIHNTQVQDISSLSDLPKLEIVNLRNTPVVDLRPLKKLLNRVALGLAPLPILEGCTAVRVDSNIAEIIQMKDEKVSAQILLDYLNGWEPPKERTNPTVSPALPPQNSAPLRTTYFEGRMVWATPDQLPQDDVLERAQMGWDALKAYRDSFGDSFSLHNHAPLPNFLDAFDRAMGDAFDPKRSVLIGMMGSRVVGLSRDQDFCANLPTGAETDLKGFAAAISTFVNRFEDWLQYEAEATPSDASVATAQDEARALQDIAASVHDTEQIDRDVADEYLREIADATSSDADPIVAEGGLASTRELAREWSEKALEGVKSGVVVRRSVDEMDKIADGEFAKLKLWSYGWTLVLLKRNQGPLRRLARRDVARYGWLVAVLDYLVGPHEPGVVADKDAAEQHPNP